MDFFETRERYRRREMRSYISLLLRVLVVGGVLWLGWLWGHAETGSLRAAAERTLYENNQQITELSTEVQRLEMELAEARAKNKVDELAQDNDAELKALVTKKIARGVAPAQIIHAIQSGYHFCHWRACIAIWQRSRGHGQVIRSPRTAA